MLCREMEDIRERQRDREERELADKLEVGGEERDGTEAERRWHGCREARGKEEKGARTWGERERGREEGHGIQRGSRVDMMAAPDLQGPGWVMRSGLPRDESLAAR